MTQNCTQHDLVRLLYQELATLDRLALLEELESDWDLKEDYLELVYAAKQLPKVQFSPSKSSIANILRHSRIEQAVS
ncbi:MAG: hypothetical protein OEQ53_03125 [Saprospiraceae bacterium]|nr:hypothetical protein [Saprospiraceae bacterium]